MKWSSNYRKSNNTMSFGRVFSMLIFVVLYGNRLTSVTGDNATENVDANVNIPRKPQNDFVIQMIRKNCFQNFSSSCFKILLIRLVDYLPEGKCKLLSGVSLPSNISKPMHILNELFTKYFEKDTTLSSKDSYFNILQEAKSCLKTLSVPVKVQDYKLARQLKFLGEGLTNILVPSSTSGRGKKGTALLYSAATLAAVGFASLAAVAGKALMASLLALMLSALGAMRGGGGGKHAHYEIIKPHTGHYQATAPAHYYDQYNVAPSSYEYARTMRIEQYQDTRPPGVMKELSEGPGTGEAHEVGQSLNRYKITTYKPKLYK